MDKSTKQDTEPWIVDAHTHILPRRLAQKIRSFFETSIAISSSLPSDDLELDQPLSCCGAGAGPFRDEADFPSHGNFSLPYPSSSIPELAQIQLECKIKGSWILPYAHKSGMSSQLNNDILTVCKELTSNGVSPIPGFTVHPEDAKEGVIKTTREALLNGAKVSKLHCSVGSYSVLDERLSGYWELAERVKFPIVIHLGASVTGMTLQQEVSSLEKLLTEYPGIRLVLAHSASPSVLDAISLAKKHRNLYLDTTPTVTRFVPYPNPTSANSKGAHQELMELAREGRILFGSDLPNVAVKIQDTIRDCVGIFGTEKDRQKLSKVQDHDLGWLEEYSRELRQRGEGDPVYEVLYQAQARLIEGVDPVNIQALSREHEKAGKL